MTRIHFCTDDYHLFLNGFSSFTSLVWMTTISFWKGCRHLHFCTNDYHFFLSGLLSCTFLYGWLPSIFVYGFSSCTFLYEWLQFRFIWVFVMHILCNDFPYSLYMDFCHAFSVQMTFHILVYGFSSCIFCAMTFHILLVFHHVCNIFMKVLYNLLTKKSLWKIPTMLPTEGKRKEKTPCQKLTMI